MRSAIVGGLPVEVEVCRNHAHARGLVEVAPNISVRIDVTARASTLDGKLRAIAERLTAIARRARTAPEISPLFLGLSIVAPGRKLARPSRRALAANASSLDPAGLANVLFVEMGSASRPARSRRALEAQYADLAANLADRGASIIALQRARNEGAA
jgi:hypothetical protein